MKCKICQNESEKFAQDTLMGRHPVEYYCCRECDFIQTQKPTWLAEAYAAPINISDVGYVSRNILLSKITHSLIIAAFRGDGSFVDYGGGYGLFTRLMRDRGFDFFRQDRFCPNLFVQNFEATAIKDFELLTAFEVFEHLEDPLSEIEQMLTYSDNIFLSTELTQQRCPLPREWWYYGLDHGQHIALYSLKSFQRIAAKFNLYLCSDGRCLHLLSRKKVSPIIFKLAVRQKVASFMQLVSRRRSLVASDHQKAIESSRAL